MRTLPLTAEAVSVTDDTGAAAADVQPAPAAERALVLWLTNVSHAVNHFQNQMISALYPVIMAELGMGYFQLGR